AAERTSLSDNSPPFIGVRMRSRALSPRRRGRSTRSPSWRHARRPGCRGPTGTPARKGGTATFRCVGPFTTSFFLDETDREKDTKGNESALHEEVGPVAGLVLQVAQVRLSAGAVGCLPAGADGGRASGAGVAGGEPASAVSG